MVQNRRKIPVRCISIVFCIVFVWFAGVSLVQDAFALEAPHDYSVEIDCNECHAVHGDPSLPDYRTDALCLTCHVNALGSNYSRNNAPQQLTHSSETTSTKYGTWTTKCISCHGMHENKTQYGIYGFDTYLVSGTITSVTDNEDGTSTFGYSNALAIRPEWADYTKWGKKSSNERGLIVFTDRNNDNFTFEILSATDSTMKVTGTASPGMVVEGSTFALAYGQNILANIIGMDTISRPVRFFTNTGAASFAFSDGLGPEEGDAVADGVCQVCHTKTSFWRNAGTGVDHNSGANCTSCHKHEQGFKAPCSTCHTNPPDTAAHVKHATVSGQPDVCVTCHCNGTHDGKIEIGFGLQSTNYDGKPEKQYEATCGTTVSLNGTMKCSNLYCHSNGTGGTLNTGGTSPSTALNAINDPRPVAQSTSPGWSTIGPLGCTACHGYPPSYMQDQPKSNTHGFPHQNITCNVCHFKTTSDGTAITDSSKHGNGIYDVDPDTAAGWNFTYRYDAGGGSCSTATCHAYGYTKIWGDRIISAGGYSRQGTNCLEMELLLTRMDGSPLPPYTYVWNFGDGTPDSEPQTADTLPITITHTYPAITTYYATLHYRDANNHPGSSATIPVRVSDKNTAPVGGFQVDSVGNCTVTIRDLSYDPDYNTCGHSGSGRISISWGDGTSTIEPIDLTGQPSNKPYSHAYTAPGTYYIGSAVVGGITIWITDNSGKGVWVPRQSVVVPCIAP